MKTIARLIVVGAIAVGSLGLAEKIDWFQVAVVWIILVSILLVMAFCYKREA